MSIDQLELLFEDAKDRVALERIQEELRFRTTPRARSLLRKVEESIISQTAKTANGSKTEVVAYAASDGLHAYHSPKRALPQTEYKTSTTGAFKASEARLDSNMKRGAPSDSIPAQNGSSAFESRIRTASTETVPTENQNRLIDLLGYLEHLAKLGEKPIFALKDYQQLALAEADLKGQVGITHDLSSDEGQIWLRIERLQRTEPPVPPQEVRDWIVLSRDPNQQPKIQDVLTRTVIRLEADELLSSGKVKADDLAPSLKLRDGKQMIDVILRLDTQPSIKSAVTSYISGKWAPWAKSEKPRRTTINIYDKFFSLYQSLQAEGVERPLEVVWGIGVARWKLRNHEMDHPLIEQLVEIDVDTESGVITIGPRSAIPQLALKAYFTLEVDGVDATLSFARHFFETLPGNEEFSPFQRTTFEPVLRFAATHMDSSGHYYPDSRQDINDRTLPAIGASLVITDTWAIYARARSANFFIEDLDRLRKAVISSPDLPGPSKKLVEPPSSQATYSPSIIDITKATLGTSQLDYVSKEFSESAKEGELEFFFPKPFNEDQVAIVQRLEEADGVVVQGPPGTGKTHTIANIICHCLATGRKVLVTSKGEAALAVLREHIPEGIRDLTISLLTSEREGLKQLERAVGLLASTATRLNPSTLERQILSGQQQIVDLKKRLVSIDTELGDFANKHLARIPYKFNAEGVLPIELAHLLAVDAEQHSWLPDTVTLDPRYDSRFNDDDISSLRKARRLLSKDICYVTAKIPALSDLPDGGQIVAIHEDLANCALVEHKIESGHFSRLRITSAESQERCQALSESIKRVIALWNTVDELIWLKPFVRIWLGGEAENESGKLLENLLIAVGDIRKKRAEMLTYAISCPDEVIGDTEVMDGVRRAAAGERPFGVLPFGKTQARQRLSMIRIEGKIPNSQECWYKVERYIAWRSKLSSTVSRWNALAGEFGLPNLKDRGDITARWLSEIFDKIERVKSAVRQDAPIIKRDAPVLFSYRIDVELVINSRDHASKAVESIEANLSAMRLGISRSLLGNYVQKLKGSSGPIVEKLRKFMTEDVGNPDIRTTQISEEWQQLCRETDRVQNLNPYLETVNRVASLIRDSGAPRWAEFVLREVAEVDDKWTPNFWSDSWTWVRFHAYLKEIDGRDRF